ncbi:Pentatricopeptide repeat-containing protein [Dichanthelium oligosanthes]|uniref:Pentatricopeptide repeat-containing protein n=1 Tax=Dichanthelium oligosanthes TaxID=888268 RepID=A0A1E5VAB6_9POAL|nr:Pentatricopeptide repeat-containing protein [Dichanthelium oligosanthes]
MALAMTSSSPQPPPPWHRRRRRSQPAAPTPNASPKPKPRAKALPLLSDVGVGRDPAAIKYYARVASNLAGAGRLRDFLLAAEGLRAAAGDDPSFAARISARLLSRGVAAAVRDQGLSHVLEFLRDADRVRVPAAEMLDADASDAVAAACRMLLEERRMVEFVEVVEALARYGFYVQGIVNPMDVLKIFVKKRDPDMAIRDFNLAQEIYEEMKKKECDGLLKLDVFTYSTMMKVFADAKMWKMASNIKEDMQAGGVRLNLVTWSSLINAYANSGLVDRAIEILEEMIRDGCQPTAPCFNIILTACVKSCQFDRAFRLFSSWKKSGIKISLSPEEKICLDGAFTFCKEYPSNGGTILVVPFRPTVTTYNILMKACGTNAERAKSVMNEMRRNGLCPDLISWSILMDIYGTSQNRDGAVQALRRMQRVGIQLNVSAYTVAIKACVVNKDLKLALHLFDEMKTHQLKPNLVTYKTLLTARSNYGSLQEVQQCLAIYQEMRKSGYQANDYYLKELIVEWCEGVLSSGSDNRDFYNFDLQPKRKESFNLFLEKVVTVLQKDVDQNQIVDVRDLSKVEARIVVLSVLRKIKEQYLLGKAVQDDVVIITGHEKTSRTEVETSAVNVEHAIVTVLTDDLGLDVLIGPGSRPPVSAKPKVPTKSRSNIEQVSKSFTRRPQGVIKIPINSLNHWLKKKDVRVVQ